MQEHSDLGTKGGDRAKEQTVMFHQNIRRLKTENRYGWMVILQIVPNKSFKNFMMSELDPPSDVPLTLCM